MIDVIKKYSWSPYMVGAGIGILSWFTYGLVGKQLGTSAPLVSISAWLTNLIAPTYVANSAYYLKYVADQPIVNWGIIMFVAIFIGSMVSSYLGNSRTRDVIPSIWRQRFGGSVRLRYVWSFIGGILLGFGARLAGGCTSGHAISGGLMLAVSGWVFTMVLFIVGVASAFIIYKR